jgi:hypothetical protein
MEVVLRVATTEEMKLETCFYHRRKLNARWLKLAEGCVHWLAADVLFAITGFRFHFDTSLRFLLTGAVESTLNARVGH